MADAGDSKSPAPRGRAGSTPASGTRGGDLRLFGAMFVLAAVVHLPAWWQYAKDPYSQTLVSDALSYDQWAQQIVGRGLAAEPVFHQAPLFPVLLSWIYRAVSAGARWNAAIAAAIVLTSLAVALLVFVGRFYLGSAVAGAAAALLVVLHGPFAFCSLKLLPVPLALATQAAALVALGRVRERPTTLAACLAGAAMGIAALARSEVLLFAPLAFASVAAAPVAARGAWRARLAFFFFVGVTLGIAPATLHNLRRGDSVLIASSSGENLYIGNRRGAQGDYTPLHPKAGDLFSERVLAREVAEKEAGRSLRASQVSAYWRRKAVAEVFSDPAGWLRLEVRKLGRILDPGDPTDIYSFPLERSLYLTVLYALPLSTWFLLVSGVMGLVVALRSLRRRAWPLVAFVATQLAVLLLFFVNTRLRLPLLFSLAPFGGLALTEGWRMWREGWQRSLVGIAAAALSIAGVAGAALTRPQPRDLVRLASVLSTQNRPDEGLRVLAPLLSASPPYALALDQAGWLLQKKGDLAGARERYRQALAAGMPRGRAPQTRTRLALVLEEFGEFDAAATEHDAAVADAGADAGTYYERGMFRLRRGERDAAVLDLEEAVRRDPSWDKPQVALAGIGRK